MNQKKAKLLRWQARNGYGADPQTTYQIVQVPKSTTNIRRGSLLVYRPPVWAEGQLILRGTYERVWPTTAKQARLKPGSVRYQYKQLKRAA